MSQPTRTSRHRLMNLKKSLKPIKKNLLHREKAFVTIRRVYSHLSELSNREILDYYQVKSVKELKAHIEHIKDVLQQEIENYKEELEKIDTCFCIDSKGECKYLYTSKKEVEKQIAYIQETKHIKLALYACPYHCGWHIHTL